MAMAAAGRQQSPRLSDRLLAAPETFEVFAAVQLVEDERAREAAATGAEPPPEVGSHDAGAGVGDPVRFRTAATLGFPGGAVVAARRLDPDPDAAPESAAGPVELEVASFGLIGPAGVLPRHYTVLVLERLRRYRDRALRDFLDLFTHRALSLLVRAFGKYRVAVQRGILASRHKGASWDEAPVPRDATTAVLACLVGLGGRTLPGRMRVADSLLLHHAGHLARQPAAALPLEQIVTNAWGVPAHVEQFVGRWLELEPADQTRLGGANALLGVDALAGRRVWSVESAYCVRLGPLSFADFVGWLPGAGRLEALSDLLTFHVGPTLEATVRPVLRAADVPQTRLGGGGQSRLGWTTWLVSRRPGQDAADAAFEVRP
jgi:type VI secretion system protein ImpH